MQIQFDAEKVKTCLEEMKKNLDEMQTAISEYEPVAKSLEGSSEEWIGPVNAKLKALKNGYETQVIPVTQPLYDWIKNVETAYADALSRVSSL